MTPEVCWHMASLPALLDALARHAGLSPRSVTLPHPPEDPLALPVWLDRSATAMGIEVERVLVSYPELPALIRQSAPSLLVLSGDETVVVGLLGVTRTSARLLGGDLLEHRVPIDALRAAICAREEALVRGELEGILQVAGVPQRRRAVALQRMLEERLGDVRLGRCWLLRPSPDAPFSEHLKMAGLAGPAIGLLGGHITQYLLWILSWWLIGRGALQGRLDRGWLLAWVLVLVSIVPLRMLVTWCGGRLAIDGGALLKKRLMIGALRTDPAEIRHEGVGALLGRVIESSAIESLALNGGIAAIIAAVELTMSGWVLAQGAGGGLLVCLLVATVLGAAALGWRYYLVRLRWTRVRQGLTHDLVERMVGHRTRLAQESAERWHQGEDEALERYLTSSQHLDAAAAWLQALVPRGWIVASLAVMGVVSALGSFSVAATAISLGGILLALQALSSLMGGVSALAGAGVAWDQVAPLLRAARRQRIIGVPTLADAGGDAAHALLEASNVRFRYQDRGQWIFDGLSLEIQRGDRVLLEGPSGGGKSTLAALLVGLRQPDSGLLLLGGLDRQSLGDAGWRRRAVCAPQFHENRVIVGTLAFNLLMGRGWPASPAELAEAQALCIALGLGPLLERMPAGLMQMVGESGWQLSHGERSRLYLARALLQGAELVVFDESFAALDPENLARALECVLERAETVMVIAHP